jgi:hypothetical protein
MFAVKDVDVDGSVFYTMLYRCTDRGIRADLPLCLIFFSFEVYMEVKIMYCIYPNISENYFLSHRMKNRKSPYNCTHS